MAAIEAERVFEIIEAFSRAFVAAVDQPAIGLQQNGGAEIAVAVPPIARAAGRAAETQNTFIQTVELGAVFRRLQAFAVGRRRGDGLDPGFD